MCTLCLYIQECNIHTHAHIPGIYIATNSSPIIVIHMQGGPRIAEGVEHQFGSTAEVGVEIVCRIQFRLGGPTESCFGQLQYKIL